jgi:glucokinase
MIELVTSDIGGTHARFAVATIAEDGAITLEEPKTFRTDEHANFQSAWEAFRDACGGSLPEAVAMSVAAPIDSDVIRFTNNPWIIRPAQIGEMLGTRRVTIVNDFAAVAHAVARAEDKDFIHLAGPEDAPLPAAGAISVLGPGTGLGVALLLRNGKGSYHVQPTEGGHVDFAPLDQIEDTILARLRKRHIRVSLERVVSGPAIVDIYETLATVEDRAVHVRDDVAIWTDGLQGRDSLAVEAVDRFCLSLGAAAGDIALAHGASGVVIAGGLGYRIREIIPKSGFADRFSAKGRFASRMAKLPVKLIIHPQPGLFGAAAAFALEHYA